MNWCPRSVSSAKLKIGDVDPRAVMDHCYTISDKALSIGGGVLEAVLSAFARRH
jgi:xanthine dehydrogenase accessory factor